MLVCGFHSVSTESTHYRSGPFWQTLSWETSDFNKWHSWPYVLPLHLDSFYFFSLKMFLKCFFILWIIIMTCTEWARLITSTGSRPEVHTQAVLRGTLTKSTKLCFLCLSSKTIMHRKQQHFTGFCHPTVKLWDIFCYLKNNIVLNITLHKQIWTQLAEIHENVTFLLL